MSDISGADQAYSDVFESYEGTVKSSSPVKVRKVYMYELCLSYSLHMQYCIHDRSICQAVNFACCAGVVFTANGEPNADEAFHQRLAFRYLYWPSCPV